MLAWPLLDALNLLTFVFKDAWWSHESEWRVIDVESAMRMMFNQQMQNDDAGHQRYRLNLRTKDDVRIPLQSVVLGRAVIDPDRIERVVQASAPDVTVRRRRLKAIDGVATSQPRTE